MKKNKITRTKTWKTLLSIFLMVLLLPVSALAAPENNEASLTIKYPVEGAYFTFYKVADFSEQGAFDIVPEFEKCVENITYLDVLEENPDELTTEIWSALASTLSGYVVDENISYDFVERTSKNVGSEVAEIIVEDIEKGLYLILGEQTKGDDGNTYTPAPFLKTVPDRDEEGMWNNKVLLDYTAKTLPDPVYDSYKVRKIWVENEGEEKMEHDPIQVGLYRINDNQEAELYETVTLSDDENWTHIWENLPDGYSWRVCELDKPDDYKVHWYEEAGEFVIVNTQKPDTPDSPGGGKLPQTGQLWWPVPFLAILGLVFFMIGWVRRNSEE